MVRFGVFEIDFGTHELRKRGVRVRLQDQPFRVLEALLEKPGEIVTREQLKERLWAEDEFVEFDKSLNTAVQKIRQALGDSAESPRFLETIPRVGYKFIAPVNTSAGPDKRTADVADDGGRNKRLVLPWALAAVLALGLAWAALSGESEDSGPPIYRITRLTSDSGLTHEPAISLDGKLVAYSSDRASPGKFDIWVQQIGAFDAIRRTTHQAHDREPVFTPDGQSIVFSSDRDGGGTYIMDALAGEPRLLLEEPVRNPQVSPDGTRLSYRGPEVVPLQGGEAIDISPAYEGARFTTRPLWMRDGKRLIYEARLGFLGDPSGGSPEDWYVVSVEDFSYAKTGFWPAAYAMGLRASIITPGSWLGSADRIVFSARLGQSRDLWTVAVSPSTGKAVGNPQRLTGGGLDDSEPASSLDGRVVYTSGENRVLLWSVDISDRSESSGPSRLSSGIADEASPMLSSDGGKVLFMRNEAAWLEHFQLKYIQLL